jgi:hypothetical protein
MCWLNSFNKERVMVRRDSPYLEHTPDSAAVPLADIVEREAPDPERVKRARQLMIEAKAGKREKRKPIEVMKMENGQYRVIDGNSTLQALKELQETTAVVIIKIGNKFG